MKLEDALGLKKGTTVIAQFSSCGPGRFTGDREYQLERDAVPLYVGAGFVPVRFKPLIIGQDPCNAYFYILDDRGNVVETTHCQFRLP